MTNKGGAPVRLLDEQELARLEKVRKRAAVAWQQMQRKAPADPLGAIAWEAGAVGPFPPNPANLVALIDRARVDGFAWREISAALGEGDSPADARRVRDRHKFWSK